MLAIHMILEVFLLRAVGLMNKSFTILDKEFSTTRRVFNSPKKIENNVSDEFPTSLFLSENINRKGEGGLRHKGHFKVNDASEPLISIITVVFNGESHIEQTIQSVINQNYNNVEYIIIDGGSTDETLSIIKKYESKIDYWVSEADSGISDAFNKGISLCQGEWVGIINADDWYQPDALTLLDFNNDAGVLHGNMQNWRGNDKGLVHISTHKDMYRTMSIVHPSVFVRKSVYKQYGFFDPDFKLAMDYELLIRFLSKGVFFVSISEVITNFRDGGASDKGQIGALREVRVAKLRYNIASGVICYLQYFLASNKARLSSIIRRSGMERFLDLYSRYISRYKQR